MINTQIRPPTNLERHAIQIIRTPQAGKLVGIALNESILGCYTHYWGGRTVPCQTEHCEACNNGAPARWHAYFAAHCPNTTHIALLEITAAAAETLYLYTHTNGTLRGAQITLRRRGEKKNGQVIATAIPGGMQASHIPEAPSIIKILAQLWHVDPALFTNGQSLPSTIHQITEEEPA
jgi:hypothetical protein